ncbi:acyl carrier protein [Streptomyces sp. NA04227]|uniref:acyl carrier protein n=1 Tax=Streptomyces sp. NA04227 TaxID=2742136 RepID=UPI00159289BB|nr:acyl carrier protein [Streptomyces sp. NA04227]QKW05286.1 acyl carrier protein [Streptomyces sp. NA04227]
MSSTYDRLVTLLAEGFGIEPEEVQPETTFADLDLDSLALVELTLAAQEEFGISLGDEDLHATNSMAQTVDVLESKTVAL